MYDGKMRDRENGKYQQQSPSTKARKWQLLEYWKISGGQFPCHACCAVSFTFVHIAATSAAVASFACFNAVDYDS
jgi:hypothetical protein